LESSASSDSLAQFLGIVFGQYILTCHQAPSKWLIPEEEFSQFSKRIEEFCGFSNERPVTASMKVKTKVTDEMKVDVKFRKRVLIHVK
jgi:hypothetical protein